MSSNVSFYTLFLEPLGSTNEFHVKPRVCVSNSLGTCCNSWPTCRPCTFWPAMNSRLRFTVDHCSCFFRTCCVGLNSCVELVHRGRTSRARRQQCGSPSLWPATRAAGCKACYASRSPRPQLRALGQDSMNSKSILESPLWGANEAKLSFELARMSPFRGTLAARWPPIFAARRGTHFWARGTPRHAF